MNRRMIFVALVAVGAFGVGVVSLVRWADSKAVPAKATSQTTLPVVDVSSWGETHKAIQLMAQPKDGGRDTAWISLAVAELPADLRENGGTVHVRVAVPEWAVFDERGQLQEYADGMLLTATVPDVGIGLELNRLELNPHKRPAERKWQTMEIKVPPCAHELGIELRAGVLPGANNAFDQVFVSVAEPLVFKNGLLVASKEKFPCAESALLGGCDTPEEKAATPSRCEKETNPVAPSRMPVGALHTGRQPDPSQ